MIICPAKVPTVEADMPEAISELAPALAMTAPTMPPIRACD